MCEIGYFSKSFLQWPISYCNSVSSRRFFFGLTFLTATYFYAFW